MLIGRDRERARLDVLLEDARRGLSRVLAVVGEPGTGKTALLAYAQERAGDLRQLTGVGVESESELPYASLHELLAPVLDRLPQLAPPQARALSAALALERGNADVLAVGAGTYSLLVDLADELPVLVVLDDVHWFDAASAVAIAFAVRRLKADQVGVLAAFRPGSAPLFETLPRLELGPLGPEDARAVLRMRAVPIAAGDESRIINVANGNPLALLELPPELAAELPRVSSGHQRLERAFAHQLESVSPDVRSELLLAAAEPEERTVRRAGELRGTTAALDEAERAGLVRLHRGTVVFRHPVLRAFVYASAPGAERAQAHRDLAAALDGDSDVDRRAWHLAAAADGPDEELAQLLERTADRAAVRGGHAAAAQALVASARLSPGRPERARRLFAAARAALQGIGAPRARALIEEALPLADDELLRFDLLLELWRTTEWSEVGHLEEALLHEAEQLEAIDDSRIVRMLGILVSQRTSSFDAAGAVDAARRIERHATGADAEWRARAYGAAACAYVHAGNRTDAMRCLSLANHPDLPTMGAFDFMALERFDELRRSLDETLRQARAEGNAHRVIWNRNCAAHLELRCGRLGAAEAAAAEAIRIGELNEEPKSELGYAVLAGVYAWRGNAEAAESAGKRAAAAARVAGDYGVEGTAIGMLALLELGRGEPAAAVALLEPPATRWLSSDVRNPCAVPFIPDLVHAYALVGDPDSGRELLDRFAPIAESFGNTWMTGACLRCRGILATTDTFDDPFNESLTLLGSSPYLLELARTQLAYGERLRRAGRRREARPVLEAAHDAFASQGATLWQLRATNELRAAGVRIASPKQPPVELTPQELAIAALAARGRSNREIAAAVFLSHKTVEYHLANTFRKLNIHSRVELAGVMADRAP